MIRHAAEQDPVEPFPSVGAHDDEIDPFRADVPDNLLGRIPGNDLHDRYATVFEVLCDEFVQTSFAAGDDLLFKLHDGHGRYVDGVVVLEDARHEEDMQIGLEGPGQGGHIRNYLRRNLGQIDRKQDLLELWHGFVSLL